MTQFPGRTLDELDQMDWGRYLRAIEVRQLQAIERLRTAQIEKGIELEPEQWQSILEHDRLANGEPC